MSTSTKLSSIWIILIVILTIQTLAPKVDAVICRQCISPTGMVADCKPMKAGATGNYARNYASSLLPITKDFNDACLKSTYFIENENSVSKFTILGGIDLDNSKNSMNKYQRFSTSTVKPNFDGSCLFWDETNPKLVNMTKSMNLGKGKVIAGRTCFCTTNLCNGNDFFR